MNMPTGPKGEKRPADVIGNAVKVMRIATGEEEEIAALGTPCSKAALRLGFYFGASAGASPGCDVLCFMGWPR